MFAKDTAQLENELKLDEKNLTIRRCTARGTINFTPATNATTSFLSRRRIKKRFCRRMNFWRI